MMKKQFFFGLSIVALCHASDWGIRPELNFFERGGSQDNLNPGLQIRYQSYVLQIHDLSYSLVDPHTEALLFQGHSSQISLGYQWRICRGLSASPQVSIWLHRPYSLGKSERSLGLSQTFAWQPWNHGFQWTAGIHAYQQNQQWKNRIQFGLGYDLMGAQDSGSHLLSLDNLRRFEFGLGLGLPFALRTHLKYSLSPSWFAQANINLSPFLGEMALWGGWQSREINQSRWKLGAGLGAIGAVDQLYAGFYQAAERNHYWSDHWGWQYSLSLHWIHEAQNPVPFLPVPALGVSLLGRL